MAIKTQDWDTFIALTRARAGARLKDTEIEDIGVLANAAARTINDYSPYWPRLLELQERSVVNGVVAYSEDSYEVKGAGVSKVNGLYVRIGDYIGSPAYTMYKNGEEEYSLYAVPGPFWAISKGGPGDSLTAEYLNPNFSGDTPPLTGWQGSQQNSPSPVLNTLDDIDQTIQVWSSISCGENDNKINYFKTEINNWYDGPDGIYLSNCNNDTVFVGFKKDLTDVYGDGTGGTVSGVPFEWTDYMSYSAARVLQDGQRNAADFAGIALRQIDEVLNNQLMKVNRANAMNVFNHSLNTYFNNDYSTI